MGKLSPCPTSVINTLTTAMKMIVSRCGNTSPSAKVTGNAMAVANETMPRIPYQLIIWQVFQSNWASPSLLD